MMENPQALVLAIDDDSESLARVSDALVHAGYACRTCGTVEAATEFVHTSPPDLILAGLRVQGRSGPEWCRQLQAEHGLDQVPLMFLSSSQGPDIIRRSDAAGAAYYVRKPCDPEVLLALIGRILHAG